MSIFNNKRLKNFTFNIDKNKINKGYFTDKYFENGVIVLKSLTDAGFTLDYGESSYPVGNMKAEMQFFHRREPFGVISGTDYALAFLEQIENRVEILSVQDGEKSKPWESVLKIKGKYVDFAMLETVILGVLSRGTMIATNTYEICKAANGKEVLFFPARFDLHDNQMLDGYSYYIGVQSYNKDYNKNIRPLVSTDAQGEWWGGKGGGTVAHAYVLCHLKDIATAMLNFAETLPPEIPRIALVDTNNDCVGDSLNVAETLFRKYIDALKRNAPDADRFRLHAVRLDTAPNLIDKSLKPTGEDREDYGVTPRLVTTVRETMDNAWQGLGLSGKYQQKAKEYYQNVKIVVSGGFDTERIAMFERKGVPADYYGVGSSFFHSKGCDYTADIVRVELDNRWIEMSKEGRTSTAHPNLKTVKCINGVFEDV